jgi:FdhD protein
MRTPGNDAELALGFLYTEGIIDTHAAIDHIHAAGNVVLVILKASIQPVLPAATRNFYASAGCGICGKSGMDTLKLSPPITPAVEPLQLPAALFHGLQDALLQQQVWFESTGGLHAAALFNSQGTCLLLREDIGRHNALDKLIGHSFLQNQLPLSDRILLLSGRAGFELIQKAHMAGIRVIAAVGAPSSLAVERAKECGMALIGFLRADRFNIYSGFDVVQ